MDIRTFKLGNNEKGSAMMETAIVVPVLFLVVIAIADLTRFGFTKMALHHSVARAARTTIVGTSGSNHTQNVENVVIDSARKFGVEIARSSIYICPTDNICSTNNAGLANQFITITVSKPLNLLFKSQTLSMSETVVIRNEPFVSGS